MRLKKRVKIILMSLLVVLIIVVGGFFFLNNGGVSFSLNGDKEMTIDAGVSFEDPGVEATFQGKDISDKVTASALDLNKLGDQTITYTLTLDGKDYTVSRTVHIKDNVPPTLNLNGGETINWKQGITYHDLGYNVFDNLDQKEDIKVTISNNVDVDKPGNYEAIYQAEDSAGNKTEVKRIIEVTRDAAMGSTSGVPVCMYHYLYKEKSNDINANYMAYDSFKEQLDYLTTHNFYFVSYSELRDFVDKKIDLPAKSIILSFDDGSVNTLKYLKELSSEYKIPITSFVITSKDGEKKVKETSNNYMIFESHSDNMHQGGGNIGHGGIFTALSKEEALKDLKTSIEKCGSGEAFCYPFGDFNDACKSYVKEAGFKVAFTTQPGKVKPGDDPYLLPRVRMSGGISLSAYKSMI